MGMDFWTAQSKMKSLLTGDIARESLEIAEDEHLMEGDKEANQFWKGIESRTGQCYRMPERKRKKCNGDNFGVASRDIPPGEDIKWMCGDCGATDWTPRTRRCTNCIEMSE